MKILILINHSLGLINFRKELLEQLIKQNNVFVSLPKDDNAKGLKKLGCQVIETKINRRGKNIFDDIHLFFKYVRTIKNIKPDIVLTFTIKPNIYGGIVCRVFKIPYIPNITGLGSAFLKDNLFSKTLKKLYRFAIEKSKVVFYQNISNFQFFNDKKILTDNYHILPGSGVNLKTFKFSDYPISEKPIRFLFVGRIMKEKGIDELLNTAKRIKKEFDEVEFNIVGFCEETYTEQLEKFNSLGIINYHGRQNNVKSFYEKAHCLIHPSYHEGMSNVMLEASATGRPVIASNIPGCKEIFEDNISGFGISPKSSEELYSTVTRFIELPLEKKKNMGRYARRVVEEKFDRQLVVDKYLTYINK